jgi:superfamily II DNA helicase RecQ
LIEREIMQAIVEELRGADYKAAGTLLRTIDSAFKTNRDTFDSLLDAMTRAALIEIENAEYEKDGEVKRFRKVRLTQSGLELRLTTPIELLISDGVVEEFGGGSANSARPKKAKAGSTKTTAPTKTTRAKSNAEPIKLTVAGEALAARLKEWRATEAKRLRVPAYVVLHDRTLLAVAQARPENPKQLIDIVGMGPAKAERFGDAILDLCGAAD